MNDMFCNMLKRVKVPDEFITNIKLCVNVDTNRIQGLKGHDYHILMEGATTFIF